MCHCVNGVYSRYNHFNKVCAATVHLQKFQLRNCKATLHCYRRLQNIIYRTVSTTQPAYLHSLLKHYVPSRTLRSSDSNLLFVPRVRTGFGSCGFSVAAPIIWNSLPLDIRNSSTISCFRRQLKTLFHRAAFRPLPLSAPSQPPDSAGQWPTLRALQIHLLTYLQNNLITRMSNTGHYPNCDALQFCTFNSVLFVFYMAKCIRRSYVSGKIL